MSAYPTCFYGWAPFNSRPTVYWSKSQNRKRLNGLLAVDATSGEEYLALVPHATAEVLALYFYEFALDCHVDGYQHLTVILDNNSTYHDYMRYRLWLRLKAHPALLDFSITFIYTPPYSPNFNLVEYVIHLLRLKLLHHLPCHTSLASVSAKLQDFFSAGTFLMSPSQVNRTLRHIFSLPLLPLLFLPLVLPSLCFNFWFGVAEGFARRIRHKRRENGRWNGMKSRKYC